MSKKARVKNIEYGHDHKTWKEFSMRNVPQQLTYDHIGYRQIYPV